MAARPPTRGDDLGHGEPQRIQSFAALGGHRKDPQPPSLELGLNQVGELGGIGHVDLVEGHQAGPVLQSAVGGELALDHVEIGQRITPRFEGGAVDHVHQGGAALDVAEELVSQSAALTGPLDQPGDVGDGVGDVAGHHHPRLGMSVVNG